MKKIHPYSSIIRGVVVEDSLDFQLFSTNNRIRQPKVNEKGLHDSYL